MPRTIERAALWETLSNCKLKDGFYKVDAFTERTFIVQRKVFAFFKRPTATIPY